MRLIGNGVRLSDCPAAVNPFMFFCGRATARYFSDIWVGRCIKNGVKSEYLPLEWYEAESPRCKGRKQFMWNIYGFSCGIWMDVLQGVFSVFSYPSALCMFPFAPLDARFSLSVAAVWNHTCIII